MTGYGVIMYPCVIRCVSLCTEHCVGVPSHLSICAFMSDDIGHITQKKQKWIDDVKIVNNKH